MTTWTDPKAGGVPFIEETLEPEHINTIVGNTRLSWILGAFRRRVSRIAELYDETGKLELYWSPTHEHILCANTSTYYQLSRDGEIVREESHSPGLADPVAVCAYEVPGSNRVETFSVSTLASTMGITLDGGTSWISGIIPTFRATGRALWTGGPNNARVVPGRYDATSTHGCVMYLAGSPTSAITRHDLTVDGDISRIATNGSGRIVFATPGYVFTNTDYGATLGSFSSVAMPTLTDGDTSAAARVGMAYDSTRNLFVMVRAQSNGVIAFTTSADGATWAAWRRFGAVDAFTLSLPDIAIVDRVWIVSGNDANYDGRCNRYWASMDSGANWYDLGRGALGSGLGTGLLTYQTNDLLQCGNSVVGVRITSSTDGAAFDLFGPIDAFASSPSVII